MPPPDAWFSMSDLPPGRVRVRVRWPGYVVIAASDVDRKGRRHWHEVIDRDLRPLRARPEAWQPLDVTRWQWPNGREPEPLPIQVTPSLATIGGVSFDATAAAAEMEEWREAARAQADIPPPEKGQWWRDISLVRYEPMGAVSLDHGEARIMRHLILERSMPLDLRRQRSNAAVLADLKLTWADIYGAQARGGDWQPPLVAQPEDHADFDVVMGWFAEVAPANREMIVLRGRMLAPPATWVELGDEISRHWTRAQQIYKAAIEDLVAAANRPRLRGEARIAALRERNRVARGRG